MIRQCKFSDEKISKIQSGQALLAVILVMVVALTIGLSVATRNITSTRLASDEHASQRALTAAEAGVEQAIEQATQSTTRGTIIGGANPTKQIGEATIENVKITGLTNSELILNGGNPVPRNESVDVWLSDYGTINNPWTGHMNIFWHQATSGCVAGSESQVAALDVYAVHANGAIGNSIVKHYPYDPCANRRAVNNFCPRILNRCWDTFTGELDEDDTTNFVSGASTVDGKQFFYQLRVGFGNSGFDTTQQGVLLRITPLYADAVIGLRSTNTSSAPTPMPEQGTIIESTGSSGPTQRKISVYRANPTLPSELFYTIFAP